MKNRTVIVNELLRGQVVTGDKDIIINNLIKINDVNADCIIELRDKIRELEESLVEEKETTRKLRVENKSIRYILGKINALPRRFKELRKNG